MALLASPELRNEDEVVVSVSTRSAVIRNARCSWLRLDTGRELEGKCLPDLEFSKRITRVEEYSKRELLEKFRKSAEQTARCPCY